MGQRAFKTDGNKNVITSNLGIGAIVETSISVALGFVAITVPAGVYLKEVILTTRDAAAFQLSNVLAGTTYSTLPASTFLQLKLVAEPADVICYIKGTSTTVLEAIMLI